MDEQTNGWNDGCVDGGMDSQMDERMNVSEYLFDYVIKVKKFSFFFFFKLSHLRSKVTWL